MTYAAIFGYAREPDYLNPAFLIVTHLFVLTINRAVRGDIGLMTWAFGLFICALAVLVTVQSLLIWCSRLENYPFSTPLLWEFFLGVSVYGACAAVVGAIALLVVTVLELKFDKASSAVAQALSVAAATSNGNAPSVVACPEGELNPELIIINNGTSKMCNLDAFGGNYAPGDAHLTFHVSTESPAKLAFTVRFKPSLPLFISALYSSLSVNLVHRSRSARRNYRFRAILNCKWPQASPLASQH